MQNPTPYRSLPSLFLCHVACFLFEFSFSFDTIWQNTFFFQVQHVRVTIKEIGNKPLAFKNCKVFCSYPSLYHQPHQKSLLRILKFKNKKNTILQLSAKPVTTNASWMSYEPKYEAQRKHLSQAKPCQPHITDESLISS